jgi:bacteriocin-like protein
MQTTQFENISDAELETVTGGLAIGPFGILIPTTPKEVALNTSITGGLAGIFANTGGPGLSSALNSVKNNVLQSFVDLFKFS